MNRFLFLALLTFSLSASGQDITREVTEPRTDRAYKLRLGTSNDLLYKPLGLSEQAIQVKMQNVLHLYDSLATRAKQINVDDLYGKVGIRTTFHTLASLRALTGNPSTAPPVVDLTGARGGRFLLNTANTTSADDGALVIVDTYGNRYERFVYDRRLTPQMFGAVGDSLTDDYAALQAWFSCPGVYELFAPAGKYRHSQALSRYNLGAVTISGSGSRTQFFASGNSSGLLIENSQASNLWKQITVRDIEIVSTGVKSTSTIALRVASHNYARPGPLIHNVSIKGQVAGYEWGEGIEFYNASNTTVANTFIYGLTRTVTKGIVYKNGGGQPATVHNISQVSIENVKRGISIEADTTGGSSGMEGFGFTDFTIVGAGEGIVGRTNHGSPGVAISNAHINVSGGDAIQLDGYQQLFFHAVYAYSNRDPLTSITPARAVYLANTIDFKGELDIHLIDGVQAGLVLAGSGGVGDLSVSVDVSCDASNGVEQACTIGAYIFPKRTRNGSTVCGSLTGTGVPLKMVGGCNGIVYSVESSETPSDGDIYRYDGTNPNYRKRPVKPHRAATEASILVVTSTTIDPSIYSFVEVNNGASNVVITVDYTKFYTGQKLTISRYDNTSTGIITVQTTANSTNLIQSVYTYALGVNTTIPTTGTRQITYWFNSVHMKVYTGTYVSSLGQSEVTGVPSIAVNGDIEVAHGANRIIGVKTGFTTGDNTSLWLSGSTNSLVAGFGLPLQMTAFHGLVIQNTSGGSGADLLLLGLNSAQPIITGKNSSTATVYQVEQTGLIKGKHYSDAYSGTPTAVTNTAAGTGATISVGSGGNDGAHELTITPGTGSTTGVIATVTLGTACLRNPTVTYSLSSGTIPANSGINLRATGLNTYTVTSWGTALPTGFSVLLNVSARE